MEAMFETRRENLRRLVMDKFEGNRAALSRAAEVHPNHVNLLLSDNPDHRRNMGENLARKIEERLGLALGYMDQVHGHGVEIEVRAIDPPEEFNGLFVREATRHRVCLSSEFVETIKSRMTTQDNLGLLRLMSHDLEPDVIANTTVIVDVGYKAVTGSGFYILQRGGSTFVRKVTAMISGGYDVTGGGDTMHMDNLKGIKVLGRLIVAITTKVI